MRKCWKTPPFLFSLGRGKCFLLKIQKIYLLRKYLMQGIKHQTWFCQMHKTLTCLPGKLFGFASSLQVQFGSVILPIQCHFLSYPKKVSSIIYLLHYVISEKRLFWMKANQTFCLTKHYGATHFILLRTKLRT